MRHIIKKQVMELELERRDDIFTLQQKASDYYYNKILPALEKIFDRLSGDDDVLQLDTLEIDLGTIRWDSAKNELNIKGLDKILQKQIEVLVKERSESDYRNEKVAASVIVKRLTAAVNAGEQWIYYMERGVLPWTTPVIGGDWKLRVLEALATEFSLVKLLREIIIKNKKALARIIREHDEVFLVKLVEILTAQKQNLLPAVIEELVLVYPYAHPNKKLQDNKIVSAGIWPGILRLAAVDITKPATMQLASQLLKDWVDAQNLTSAQLVKIAKKLNILKPMVEEIREKIKKNSTINTIQPHDGVKEEGRKSDTSLSPEIPSKDKQAKAAKKEKEQPAEKDKKPKGSTEEETTLNLPDDAGPVSEAEAGSAPFITAAETIPEGGLFVQNAGLVLLHPFLKQLYKNTAFIREGEFITRELQGKAVLLLHYLATGNTEPEDHLLAVPKILCSWPLDEPLELHISLNEKEKSHGLDLLHAALEQWTIIRNTSADGLREGFLQRSGKVIIINDNIYFHLEKSAIDVLLDHLPWNLSVIKLPWIKNLLRVEWR